MWGIEVVALCPAWLCRFLRGELLGSPIPSSLCPAPQRGKGGLLLLMMLLTFGQEEEPM